MEWLYDREGNLLTTLEWGKLFEDKSYQILAQEHIGPYFVSTVWLGMNHNYFEGPPLIFETMVFKGDYKDIATYRYATEDEALEGHAQIVNEVKLFDQVTK